MPQTRAAPAAPPRAAAKSRRTAETASPLALDDRVALVLAFAGSGCLLILEIVAGRLLAPLLGVSLYTWTAVIGVVLAGVSLGNYLGGRLADQRPSRSTVALIYLAGSLASLLVLLLVRYAEHLQLPSGAPAALQVLWLTALLFFVPSTIIAASTPVLTRLSLHSVDEGGRVVGRIQAAAALGSIVGTFLTGFLLISEFGTRRIVAGVALTLLILALAARPPWLRRRVYELASLFVVIVAAGTASHSDCLRESDYYCIRVDKVGLSVAGQSGNAAPNGEFRALYLDRLLHGIVDLSQPTFLYYPYEQIYAFAVASAFPLGSRIDAFFLGGGEYAFPRYVEAQYKGSIDVAEIDPAVTETAREDLGLRSSARLKIHHEDARRFVRELPAGKRYDVILGDTFNDYQVPYHLTTREFNDELASHLNEDGLYLLNVIDGEDNEFLRSEIMTLRETFPYVSVLRIPGRWPPRRQRTTYVLVAGNNEPSRPLPAAADPDEIEAFVRGGHGVVLTDDHVPVDQLLAPVFRQAIGSSR